MCILYFWLTFFQYFIISIFKYTEELKELYNEHPDIHPLVSHTYFNTPWLYHISLHALSIHQYIIFLNIFQSKLSASMYFSLLQSAYHWLELSIYNSNALFNTILLCNTKCLIYKHEFHFIGQPLISLCNWFKWDPCRNLTSSDCFNIFP